MQTRSCSEAKGIGGVFASERSGVANTLTIDSVIVHAIVMCALYHIHLFITKIFYISSRNCKTIYSFIIFLEQN